ncbi:MAG: RsmB/NOP family class I SAM-dependent RNA methyltransferase [Chlamydiota bacterium]|nr:RsmB/NOP family class I SAM-dependent RNA methyltransferase [Chlamydiota bacterium]
MKHHFPRIYQDRFALLGLDIEKFYHTRIRKCFRLQGQEIDMNTHLFDPVLWYPENAYFFEKKDDDLIKKLFQEGKLYIQDAASLIAPLVLAPDAHHRVLDCCAAPGTKTLHLSYLMGQQGELVANESYRSRFYRLSSNLKRFGGGHVSALNYDARYLTKIFEEASFDRILLDAPCSGEGMVTKIHKVLKMWNVKRIRKLSKLQKQLLESAYHLLKPDGVLVYSTCTLAPEENEQVVQHLLISHPSAKINPISIKGLQTRPGISMWKDQEYIKEIELAMRIYPEDYGTNGFFIAEIHKKST